MNWFYKYFYSCFKKEKKITPEEKIEIKKQRIKMLLPFYRPDVYV